MVSFKLDHQPHVTDLDLVSWTLGNDEYDQDKPILIDVTNPHRFITAKKARTTVRKLVAGFHAIGLSPGDCVCVHSFNEINYPLLYLGIIGAGGRFTGSNPGYTSWELVHHVRTADVKYIIAEPHMLPTVLSTAKECNIPDSSIYVFDAFDHGPCSGLRSWEELLQHGQEDWVRLDNANTIRDTIASLSFTSGTTGLPKAAMIPHSYAVSQSFALQSPPKPYKVSRLLCLPAFHAFATPLHCANPLREGHSAYIMRRFDIQHFLEAIERFRITELFMVPPMIVALLMSPLTQRELLQSIRYLWSGGAPLRSLIQCQMQALLSPEAKVSQVWGMTESGWTTCFSWPEGDETGSVGRALPSMEMKLIDLDGNVVDEDHKQGELYVKGPCMMLGYLGNQKASEAAFDADGWLRTGDIAYCNQGKWYVVDRKKELIKVRGWQVAPAELESVLLAHPQIIDAAVIGIPLPDGTGEVPRAYVVRRKKALDVTFNSTANGQHRTNDETKGENPNPYSTINGEHHSNGVTNGTNGVTNGTDQNGTADRNHSINGAHPPSDSTLHEVEILADGLVHSTSTLLTPSLTPSHTNLIQADVQEEDIKLYLATRLAKYKALDGGVRFVDVIPKNPSGKILKRVLRIEAQAEEGEAVGA